MPKREWAGDSDDDAADVLDAKPLWSKATTTNIKATPAANNTTTNKQPQAKHNDYTNKNAQQLPNNKRKKHAFNETQQRLRQSIDKATKTGDAFAALALFDEAVAENIYLQQHTFNVLLYLCGGSGESFGGSKGSGYTEKPDANRNNKRVSYTEEQHAHLRARMADIYEYMQRRNVEPTEMTFTALARAAAAGGAPERAAAVAQEAVKRGTRPKLRTFAPAIHGFAAAGDAEKAIEMFNLVESSEIALEPSEAEYGALLSACAVAGRPDLTDRAWDLIQRLRCKVATLKKLPASKGVRSAEPEERVLCGEAEEEEEGAPSQPQQEPKKMDAPADDGIDTAINVSAWPPAPRGIAQWFMSESAKADSPQGLGYAVWRARYDGDGCVIKEHSRHVGSSPGSSGLPQPPPEKLSAVELHLNERTRLLSAIESHARSRESNIPGLKGHGKKKQKVGGKNGGNSHNADVSEETPESAFLAFKTWLRSEQEAGRRYTTIIDGANVGMANQSSNNGMFSVEQVEKLRKLTHRLSLRVWNEQRETNPDLPPPTPPLIVLHTRRANSGPAQRHPKSAKIIKYWKEEGYLFETPCGSNDDWYWLYASVFAGNDALLVTNDEMRDHIFASLRAEGFMRWKERHIARFELDPLTGANRVVEPGNADAEDGGFEKLSFGAVKMNQTTVYPPLAFSLLSQQQGGSHLFPLVTSEDGIVESSLSGGGGDAGDGAFSNAVAMKSAARHFDTEWLLAVPYGVHEATTADDAN